MNNTIQYAVDSDGIALLTIDLPGMPMNVLTPELMEDLSTLTQQAADDDAVKGIVITSGKKAFIAGADIKDMVTAYDRGMTHKEATEFSYGLNLTLRRMETCGKPVAVAINGTALGGGLELCLACHYRVVANNPKAVLGLPEVKVGLIPGAGGTQRLPRLTILSTFPAKTARLPSTACLTTPGAVTPAARWTNYLPPWLKPH